MRRAFVIALAFTAIAACRRGAQDDKAIADFYAGKTFNVVVGFSPGGIFDLYARILARHIGAHIPGKPNVIVQNMPGAGGRRLANAFQLVGPNDGTAIGITTPGIVTDQVMNAEGVQYDLRKFHWIGSPADEVNVLWVWHTTPVKTIDDVETARGAAELHRSGLAELFRAAHPQSAPRHEVQGHHRLSGRERSGPRDRARRGRRPRVRLDRTEDDRATGSPPARPTCWCSRACARRPS